MFKFKNLTIIIIMLSLFFVKTDLVFANNEKKDILIINSYHNGYKWSDDIIDGIESVIHTDLNDINLHIEYMDTQRIEDLSYLKKLFEIYKYKFKDRKFDLVICSDDNAFSFCINNHEKIFPDTPVVFCGVNYFVNSMLKNDDYFAGVVEIFDIEKNIELILKLHPKTENIYIINDKTKTGKAIRKIFNEVIPKYENRINFISLEKYSMSEIINIIKELPTNSVVLYSILFQDNKKNYFAYDESIKLISESSDLPIYGLYDFSLGNGIIGGFLTSGYYQGVLAANMALKILNGEKVSDLGVIRENLNRYMFDYQQMKKFGIKTADLPAGSMIINQTFNEKKQVLILNSYHYGMKWTDDILKGINNKFQNSEDIEFYYDFMDTKRNSNPNYLQKISFLLKNKYKNKEFDAVITCDDNAYNFMNKYHKEVFPETPVIFCGVNYFSEKNVQNKKFLTGVVESIDLKENIDLILNLHPNTKKIVVINDASSTGKANKKLLLEIIPQYNEIVNFEFWEDYNMSEIQINASKLSSNTIILLMTFNEDKSNNFFTYEESAKLISKYSNVPVYGAWDMYLGHGIVGGKLTNGISQGEIAAELLKQIFEGKVPQEVIAIDNDNANKFMFDYEKLKEYNIATKKLPLDSIIINKPPSIYKNNKITIWTTIIFTVVLLIIAMINKSLAKKAETDSLTGVFNRRMGMNILEKTMENSIKNKLKFTICFIDIDNLKKINDKFGHLEGDNLIKKVTDIIQIFLRKSDALIRYGGDEFLIILPETDKSSAEKIIYTIKNRFSLENESKNNKYRISISSGLAEFNPENVVSISEIVNKADHEMYLNKKLKPR